VASDVLTPSFFCEFGEGIRRWPAIGDASAKKHSYRHSERSDKKSYLGAMFAF
jgi:hypothetical protein